MKSVTILENKCLTLGFAGIFCTFILLDTYLFNVIHSKNIHSLPYHVSQDGESCYISPFCILSIKSLFLDYSDFYVQEVLARFIQQLLNMSQNLLFVTPNMLSFGHIGLAFLAAKFICSDSLCTRRLGVILFEIRNFIDAMDGTLARARKSKTLTSNPFNTTPMQPTNPSITMAPPIASSAGYYIDGICDGVGCIALYTACMIYLRNYPCRRSISYQPLSLVILSRKGSPLSRLENGYAQVHKSKHSRDEPLYMKIFLSLDSMATGMPAVIFGLLTLASSTFWNLNINRYTEIFEYKNASTSELQRQLIQSNMMGIIIVLWRTLNPQALVEYLLVFIFLDRLRDFLYIMQYIGPFLISVVITATELHYRSLELIM